MKHSLITDNNNRYSRISKAVARKLFDLNCQNVVICPANLRPGFPFAPHAAIRNEGFASFDQIVNQFSYYTCNSKESGYYAAFYLVAPISHQEAA